MVAVSIKQCNIFFFLFSPVREPSEDLTTKLSLFSVKGERVTQETSFQVD